MNENSIPLINITVDAPALNKDSFILGQIEITDKQRRTDANFETVSYICKLRVRGHSTEIYDKKSFAVKLLTPEGDDLDANILGIRNENSWILDAMSVDRIRMRNRICFDVWNEISKTPYDTKYDNRNGTKGYFVELFINGDYNGIYCLTDKIDRKLLGLKKTAKGDDGCIEVRGLLYKGDSWASGSDLLSYDEANCDTVSWNAWELQYPSDYPSNDTWFPLIQLIDFCSASTTTDQFCKEYKEHFYIDNLVDYFVFTVALKVGDNFYKNTFLSNTNITKNHPQFLITPWDLDESFGFHWSGRYEETLSSLFCYNEKAPYDRLIIQNIDDFRQLLTDKWNVLRNTFLSCNHINDILDKYANQLILSGAWKREVDRWNDNPVSLKENIFEDLAYVKNWYKCNYDNISNLFQTGAWIYTGISKIQKPVEREEIYTLLGRRIDKRQLKKGVYVLNRKIRICK